MPLGLVKLYIEVDGTVGGTATTTTDTDVTPDASRFVATVLLADVLGGTTTIPAASFSDDTGTTISALPAIDPGSQYFNVYVNGVLQQGDLSTLTTANLTISSALLVGVPVVLEIVETTAVSTSTTDVSAVTVTSTVNT